MVVVVRRGRVVLVVLGGADVGDGVSIVVPAASIVV
jgi:hypothetical protein